MAGASSAWVRGGSECWLGGENSLDSRRDFMGGIVHGGNGRGCFIVRIGRWLRALFGL